MIKELIDSALYPAYVARGRLPWSLGYYTARKRAIEGAIDGGLLRPGMEVPSAYGVRLDERVIEYPWIYAHLPASPGVVLDAGSSLNHLFLLRRPPIADAKLTICTLAPEKRCYWKRGISYVFDDLRESRFRSAVFDTVVSISTIEHIGLDNTLLYTSDSAKREHDSSGYVAAVREFKRVVKPGGTCLITVPFGKAKNHGWFQVFDQSMVEAILESFQPARSDVEYFGYSERGWRRGTAGELREATVFDIHARTGFDADCAAGGRAVVCIRLTA